MAAAELPVRINADRYGRKPRKTVPASIVRKNAKTAIVELAGGRQVKRKARRDYDAGAAALVAEERGDG